MIGEECQQREMLTVVHRTLDTGRCSRAKSTVEKYAVVQVMELHDESVSRLQTGVHVVVRGQKMWCPHIQRCQRPRIVGQEEADIG